MKKVVNYLHGVKVELSRVKWPSKKEVFKYSLATLAFIVFFGLLFYGIDILVAFVRELMK